MAPDIAPATQLTDEPSSKKWIDGPVWMERGEATAISNLSDTDLYQNYHKALGWAGKHANNIMLLQEKLKTLLTLTDQMKSEMEARHQITCPENIEVLKAITTEA